MAFLFAAQAQAEGAAGIRGHRYYMTRQYDKAIVEYERAYQEVPASKYLYNIARSHHHLGHKQDAVVMYQRFLLKAPTSEKRTEAERFLAELRAQIEADQRIYLAVQAAPRPPSAPLYLRPWFWGILGAGVAAAATAVGLGVSLTRPTPPLNSWEF